VARPPELRRARIVQRRHCAAPMEARPGTMVAARSFPLRSRQ